MMMPTRVHEGSSVPRSFLPPSSVYVCHDDDDDEETTMNASPAILRVLVHVCFLVCAATALSNDRPIIGILTQDTRSTGNIKFQQLGRTYIPASYVKWVESAGARVVPIPYDADKNTLKHLFECINGLLLPGGDIYLPGSLYYNNSKFLFDTILQANDRGDYFPIWGTCQGFEQLAMLASGNLSILNNFDAEDISLPLTFTKEAQNSKLFGAMPRHLWHAFQSQPITQNLHSLGVDPDSFRRQLSTFFRALSTNFDSRQKEFISTFEAIKYPIYATQFHPERNAFEWDLNENLNHSTDAVEAMHYLAKFFVSEARKSQHKFVDPNEEFAALIYNTPPTDTRNVMAVYTQVYFWK
jgi:gamma-glutamyl hydrolase